MKNPSGFVGRKLLLAAAALATVAISQAQSPPVRPGFEVASVRPAANPDGQALLQAVPGRLRMTNLTLRRLLLNAYGVQDYQLLGDPPWLASEHYDIHRGRQHQRPADGGANASGPA